jgi:hypothetical protein
MANCPAVIPAQAGIQNNNSHGQWIPACAGMTLDEFETLCLAPGTWHHFTMPSAPRMNE